jgi:hypothetical protein
MILRGPGSHWPDYTINDMMYNRLHRYGTIVHLQTFSHNSHHTNILTKTESQRNSSNLFRPESWKREATSNSWRKCVPWGDWRHDRLRRGWLVFKDRQVRHITSSQLLVYTKNHDSFNTRHDFLLGCYASGSSNAIAVWTACFCETFSDPTTHFFHLHFSPCPVNSS